MSNVRRLILTPRLHEVRFNPRVAYGLRGEVHVAKFGRDGQRVPVRVDRGKRAFQRVWDHRQPNLITNDGMDYGIGGTAGLSYRSLTTWVAVGTGSSAPSFANTALVNEVGRTNQTLGLGTDGTPARPSETVGTFTRVRAFDYGEANGNLTEFGGSRFSSEEAGSLYTRGLFEDEFGNPTTITKTSDEQLRLTYVLTSTVSGPTVLTPTTDITFTGLGVFAVSWMQYQDAAARTDASYPMGIWIGGPRFKLPTANFPTVYGTSSAGVQPQGISGQGIGGFGGYVGGSFERSISGTWPTTAADQTVLGILLGGGFAINGFTPYFGWLFTSPASLTKEAEYRLVLNATFTVSRA